MRQPNLWIGNDADVRRLTLADFARRLVHVNQLGVNTERAARLMEEPAEYVGPHGQHHVGVGEQRSAGGSDRRGAAHELRVGGREVHLRIGRRVHSGSKKLGYAHSLVDSTGLRQPVADNHNRVLGA